MKRKLKIELKLIKMRGVKMKLAVKKCGVTSPLKYKKYTQIRLLSMNFRLIQLEALAQNVKGEEKEIYIKAHDKRLRRNQEKVLQKGLF